MPIVSLFDKTYEILEKTLDITQKRHNLISSNVANVDTPGFRAKDLPFDITLKRAMEGISIKTVRTHPKHFGSNEPNEDDFQIIEEGITGVDIDKEMTRLAENNLRYQTGIEILLRKFSGLKNVIIEGGR